MNSFIKKDKLLPFAESIELSQKKFNFQFDETFKRNQTGIKSHKQLRLSILTESSYNNTKESNNQIDVNSK